MQLVKISVTDTGAGGKGGILNVDGVLHWQVRGPWLRSADFSQH
jgi:hypothetical protein